MSTRAAAVDLGTHTHTCVQSVRLGSAGEGEEEKEEQE